MEDLGPDFVAVLKRKKELEYFQNNRIKLAVPGTMCRNPGDRVPESRGLCAGILRILGTHCEKIPAE